MAETPGRAAFAAAALVGAGLALGACTIAAPPPTEASLPSGAAIAAPPRPAPPPVRPVHKPPPPPALAALPSAEPPASSFDSLHGLDESEALALLGEPKERADAPPAILWRYASRDCDLDLYFYLDLQSRQTRVLHYEVRDHDDRDQRTQQRCYRELVTERHVDQVGSTNRSR